MNKLENLKYQREEILKNAPSDIKDKLREKQELYQRINQINNETNSYDISKFE